MAGDGGPAACGTVVPDGGGGLAPAGLMNELLDEVWSPFRQTMRPFEADVVELGDELRVTAELPGVSQEDLDVTLENNVLTISGEKKEGAEAAGENGRFHLMERRWGRFSRSFALPRQADAEAVHAAFENGILTVRVPKTEDARRRRIPIGHEQKELSGSTG